MTVIMTMKDIIFDHRHDSTDAHERGFLHNNSPGNFHRGSQDSATVKEAN